MRNAAQMNELIYLRTMLIFSLTRLVYALWYIVILGEFMLFLLLLTHLGMDFFAGLVTITGFVGFVG
jgi:hypothetical protein